MLELLGLEVGVGLRQLGRGRHHGRRRRHRRRWSGATGHRVGHAAPVALQLVDPDRAQQRAQVVGPVGDMVEVVGVRGRGEGHPRATKRSSRPGPGTARPPACASPTTTARPPCPTTTAASAMRSHHSPAASGTWPATLIRSGWASTSQAPEAASSSMAVVYGVPAGVDLAHRPLRHGHRVVQVVEAPAADPVHRAEQDVEGVALEEPDHVGPYDPRSSRPPVRSRRAGRPPLPPARTVT